VFAGNTETTKSSSTDRAAILVGVLTRHLGRGTRPHRSVAVNVDEILIVLNKIDRATPDERQQHPHSRLGCSKRASNELRRIYEVSALNRLTGSSEGDDWICWLRTWPYGNSVGEALTHSARSAACAGFQHLCNAQWRTDSGMQEPIADSEQRVTNLKQTVSESSNPCVIWARFPASR